MQVFMNRRSFLKLVSLFSMAASTDVLFSYQSKETPAALRPGLSDYPFAPEVLTGLTIEGLQAYYAFGGEKARMQIERKNALKLFSRFSKV